MKKTTLVLACMVAALTCSALEAQPVVQECNHSTTRISLGASGLSVIDIGESIEIEQVEVRISIEDTWAGTLSVSVESPEGTEVDLHDGGGFSRTDIDCLFSDAGLPNTGDPLPGDEVGVPSIYDCGGCRIETPAHLDSSLADLEGQDASGEWTLSILNGISFGVATLETWCVDVYGVAPVEDLTCSRGGDGTTGVAVLSWTNGADYSSVRIHNNGDLLDEVVGEFIEGESYEFETPPVTVPQQAQFTVVGVLDTVEAAAAVCLLDLPTAPIMTVAVAPEFDLSPGLPPYLGTASFESDAEIADIMVSLDVSHPFIEEIRAEVASPLGTVVQLHKGAFASEAAKLESTYWNFGRPNGSLPYDANELIQPTGPGSLLDFVGETALDPDAEGRAWAMGVSLDDSNLDGTVNEWSISIFDVVPPKPPSGLVCDVPDGEPADTVLAVATAQSSYSRVRWFVNDDVADEEEFDPPLEVGEEISLLVEALPLPSRVDIRVQGFVEEGGSEVGTPFSRCSRRVTLSPPIGVFCVPGTEAGSVLVSWEIPEDVTTDFGGYDAYDIYIDGEFEETVSDGLAVTYESPPVETDTEHRVGIRGLLDDPASESDLVECRVVILEPLDIQQCAGGVEAVVGSTTSALFVDDVLSVSYVEIFVLGESAFFPGLDISIEGPSGDRVVLHDTGGPFSPSEICAIWSDDGTSFSFADCLRTPPQGPGDLSDFIGTTTEGDWALELSGLDEYDLDLWCLRLDTCPVFPPDSFAVDVVADDEVLLTWINDAASEYDEIRVFQDGELVSTLAGSEEEASISGLEMKRYRFAVAGVDLAEDCVAMSEEEITSIGFLSTCIEDFLLELPGADSVAVDIGVLDSVVVGHVEVLLDTEELLPSQWAVFVESPFGTEVQLHNRQGVADDGFSTIWSNRPESSPASNGPEFSCDLCVQEPGPGSLEDFRGELSDGDWRVEFDYVNFGGEMTINALCIDLYEGCIVVPPSDLACEAEGANVVLTWVNEDEYDRIFVFRDGEAIALDLDGDSEMYADEQLLAGFYSYRVFGESDDAKCKSGSHTCEIAKGVSEFCLGEAGVIGGAVPGSTSHVVEVPEDLAIDDVRVVLDISFGFMIGLQIEIQNPDESVVTLHDATRAGDLALADMAAIFSDNGAAYPGPSYNCECEIQPSGPGALGDFVDNAVDGDWSLEVTHLNGSFGTGTLNEFCLQFLVGCPIGRPVIETCEVDETGLPPVSIQWANDDDYDAVEVMRGQLLIASLEGDATRYVDDDVTQGGILAYSIVGIDEDEGCGKHSVPCEISVGRLVDCSAPSLVIESDGALHLGSLFYEHELLDPSDEEVPAIGEVEVDVDISTTFVGSLSIDLVSPDLTIVGLHHGVGGLAPGLAVTFSDHGEEVVTDWLCECRVLSFAGTGGLADLAGEDPNGQWLLAVTDQVGMEDATLNEWCVAIYPEQLPVIEEGPLFLRGDADNNGTVSAIPDGLRILGWGAGNASEPPCMAAADVDNSGTVSSLPDGLRLLNWGSGGALPPPAPGPDECGRDPEEPETGGVPEGCASKHGGDCGGAGS